MDGHECFASQVDAVCRQFPKFHTATTEDGRLIISGELDVIDRDGTLWESYQVEIHPTNEFPHRFPLVFETGGKIPRIADWHIYEDSNSCCIGVLPYEILSCKNGITLESFIKTEVIPYFFNQTHRRVEGYYKNGEYAHGLEGIFQFYDNILDTKGDVRKTISMMLFVAKGSRPGRTHDCFCGSKKKFRKCHRAAFDKLEKIGKQHLESHAYLFAKTG